MPTFESMCLGMRIATSALDVAFPISRFYMRELNWRRWYHDEFPRTGPTVIIIGGIFNFRHELLGPVLHWYLTQGYNAYAIAPLSFAHYRVNMRYIERQLSEIEKRDRSVRESDQLIIVGWSMGGVLGSMVSMLSKAWSPRIVKVVSLGTPFTLGIAEPHLREIVMRHTKISERLWQRFDRNGGATTWANQRLVNVGSSDDFIAPFSHCYIPGSTCPQIDVANGIDGGQDFSHQHFITKPLVHEIVHGHLSA
jgi:pimeloyl-ACP methyl ester carboxylesterase